jgi:hypothetical protein
MAEISLAKGLTGREALDSMLFEVRQKLAMHGRFGVNMNYPGYRAEVSVKFYPAASFVPPIECDLSVEKLTGAEGEVVSQTATVEQTVTIPVRPPNQVREDADLPTPVLTQDASGQTVERYVKRKPGFPKNKVKGGETEPAVTMVPTAIPVAK